MYGQTEELFFLNHDYGGPYWDRTNAVAQRTYAHSPHRFVEKWDTPIMVITGEYDFRIPYTQSLVWWISRTRGTRCSSRRTRWCGTANSSAGSTAT